MNNKYTFMDLLDGKVQLSDNINFTLMKIEIPIIQRDYVQGQKEGDTLNKTGKRFVQSIFQSLQNNSQMDLDFIYGSVENGKFIPLDGQQRLTTLFLLHWYFACKCLSGEKLEDVLKKLSIFSYETRISSRDFCSNLCKLKFQIDNENQPSVYIKNESWFFNKFKQDPTVSSMLNMLDEIYELDKNANITFEKLNLLKFQILPLTQFGLTEELYLKMNARGKLLTNFEKFKAEIESKAEKENWEKDISGEDKFSFKADRIWTDLFWNRFKTGMDFAFLNFIAEYMIIYLAKNIKNLENDDGKKSIAHIQKIYENPEELSVDDFDEKSFDELKNILNLYSKNSNDLKVTNINLWNFTKNDESLFNTVCKKGATYPTKALFYAQTLYIKKVVFDQDRFDDWMRVIRNIAKNSTVDTVQTFRGFLNLIDELSNGSDDIHKYLSQNKIQSNFADNQVNEEIFKAKNINPSIKPLITQLEENNFCKGRIYFAIYCAGIELYESSEEKINKDLLEKVKSVFDNEFNKDDISNDFRVLLFTCGNNKFYEYWWSWSYRTETNKRCCIESTEDLKWNFSRKENSEWSKNILKEAVLKIANSNSSIEQIISEYECPTEMPTWEKWIIKNPKEFAENCSGHYFGITTDDKTCYLYEWRKRPNSREDCFKVPN